MAPGSLIGIKKVRERKGWFRHLPDLERLTAELKVIHAYRDPGLHRRRRAAANAGGTARAFGSRIAGGAVLLACLRIWRAPAGARLFVAAAQARGWVSPGPPCWRWRRNCARREGRDVTLTGTTASLPYRFDQGVRFICDVTRGRSACGGCASDGAGMVPRLSRGPPEGRLSAVGRALAVDGAPAAPARKRQFFAG